MNKSTHKINALIIDDESDICFLLGAILRQKRIHSQFARSIREAEFYIQNQHFNYIFLDNHLPDGLGTTLVEKIRKYQSETPIVMITAHDTSADRKLAEKAGIHQFIGKPFTKEIILNALEKMENVSHNG